MASSKSASIRLNLNSSAYVKGLKDIDRATVQTARRIESAVSKALGGLNELATAAASLKGAMAGVKLGVNPQSALNSIKKLEAKALASAKKIQAAYKDAASGIGTGKGPSAGGSGSSGGSKGGSKGMSGRAKFAMATDLAKAGLAGGALVGGGLLGLAKEGNQVREAANRLSINSRGSGEGYVDPATLTKEFFAITQNIKGVTAEQAAEAATAFVSMTGDLKTARSSLKDFATVASATGASVSDVAKTAAAVSQQFGITDPEAIKDVLASLTYQGKAGAFELADAASLFPRLAAAGSSFGLDKGTSGVKTLGGITQIARTATGSGEQAATAVESMLTKIKTESDKLTAQGVKVYDKGKVRDLPSILVDTISKVGGTDVEKKNSGLATILGEQGIRAVNPLIAMFNDTFRNTKGNDAQKRAAAEEAIRKKLNDSINAAGNWQDVVSDSARAQEDASAKATAALERLKESAANKLLPALLKLEPAVTKAFDTFAKLVDWGAENPGKAVAGAIVGSMVAAGIGEAVKGKLIGMLAGGGGGGAGGIGGVPTPMGTALGAAAVAGVAGYVAYDQGKELHNQWDENSSSQLSNRFSQVGLFGEEANAVGAMKGGTSRWAALADQARAAAQSPTAPAAAPKASPLPNKMQIEGTPRVHIVNAHELRGNQPPTPGFVPR